MTMMSASEPRVAAELTAENLGIPEQFNVASYFVDRNVAEGRGHHLAIVCDNERVTYDQVLETMSASHTSRCWSVPTGGAARSATRWVSAARSG
jgi:hypothetical protein